MELGEQNLFEIMQKSIKKIILKKPRCYSLHRTFLKTNVLTIYKQYAFNTLKYYEIYEKKTPMHHAYQTWNAAKRQVTTIIATKQIRQGSL